LPVPRAGRYRGVLILDCRRGRIEQHAGNATTRRIRAHRQWHDLPIVFLTAKAMPGDRESSLAAGATDYITKPVDLDELLGVMASWVTGNGKALVRDDGDPA